MWEEEKKKEDIYPPQAIRISTIGQEKPKE